MLDFYGRNINIGDFIFGERVLGLVYRITERNFSFYFTNNITDKVNIKTYDRQYSRWFSIIPAEDIPDEDLYFQLAYHKKEED